jgi:hypothetical protein
MTDFIDWVINENSYMIEGRFNYLKTLEKLSNEEKYELEDVEERWKKIQISKDAEKQRDIDYHLRMTKIQQKEDDERALLNQEITNNFRKNKDTKAIITDAFRNYVNDELTVDNKFQNTIRIRFYKNIIEQINNLRSGKTYKIYFETNDASFDKLYKELVQLNYNHFISKTNFINTLFSFINSIIITLENQNNEFEITYKEVHKKQKNDWANIVIICEHCKKTYLQSKKSRHLATKVCQKARI